MTIAACGKCRAGLVIDEGATLRVRLNEWRMNKETGRVTAQCPECGHTHPIHVGNGGDYLVAQTRAGRKVALMFSVGAGQ